MSALGPLVVAMALALALGVALALVVRAVEPLVTRGSSAFWAAAVLAPSALGAIAVVAVLAPGVLAAACHCAPHGNHHPHLCWAHPSSAEPLVVPALAIVGGFALSRAPAVFAALAAIVRSCRLGAAVRATRSTEIAGVRVHVLDCGEPTAFTVGVWAPHIVVDRSLSAALDARDFRAVVHHERAHVVRRDGLTLAALRLAAAWFPFGLLGTAVERWTAASELECDRHAAAVLKSATDVAAALVAVERLRRGHASGGERMAPAIESSDLERRVRTLLGASARPASLASDVVSVAIVVAGLVVLAALWPGDAAHHVAETLLGAALFH